MGVTFDNLLWRAGAVLLLWLCLRGDAAEDPGPSSGVTLFATTAARDEWAVPPGRALPLERRASGWFDRRIEPLDWEGWTGALDETTANSSPSEGLDADLRSTWFFRRSDLPHVYLSMRLVPQTGVVELRGVRLRLRDEGLGFYVERGEEDRDARAGFDFRRSF